MNIKPIFFVFLLSVSSFASAQELSDTIQLNAVEIIEYANKKIPYIRNIVVKSDMDMNILRDVGDALRSIPNVSGLRKGGANIDPVVRGFKYSQLMTLINGAIEIEGGCPNRMDPTTSHIDIDDVEQIEVIKGPYALRYGPSFGGVINLITYQPKFGDKFEVHTKISSGYESNWNGNKEHLVVTGGTKKINFMLTGNRMQYGNYDDGNDNIYKSSFLKYSYSGKVGFSPVEKHHFTISYLGTMHRNVYFPALPMDEREDNSNIIGLTYSTGKHKGVFSGAYFKANFAMVNHIMDNKSRANADTNMVAVTEVDANTLGIRGGVDLKFKDKYFLFIGSDFQYITKEGERTKTLIMQPPVNGKIPQKIEALWNNAHIQNIGIYTEFKTAFGTFDIVGAIRLDLNSAGSGKIEVLGMPSGGITPVLLSNEDTKSSFTNFSFNVGATKQFGKYLSLGLSLGRGTRSPNMVERFIIMLPVGYDNYDYFGNPKLKPENNNEADLTLKFKHEKYGAAEFNIFYSLVQNYITGRLIAPSVQKPLSMNVLGVKQFYNAGLASFTGFEFGYSLPTAYKLGANVTVAYTHATIYEVTKQILDPTQTISQQVVGEEVLQNDAVAEIPPLEANVSISYKFLKKSLIPRVSARIVLDQGHVSEAFYEPSTPGFVLFNLGLMYKYNDHISINGGVNNLLDKAYYEHLNRKMIGTTAKLYEPGRVFYINLFINI
jgi:iron complex outermembrane receptor protein